MSQNQISQNPQKVFVKFRTFMFPDRWFHSKIQMIFAVAQFGDWSVYDSSLFSSESEWVIHFLSLLARWLKLLKFVCNLIPFPIKLPTIHVARKKECGKRTERSANAHNYKLQNRVIFTFNFMHSVLTQTQRLSWVERGVFHSKSANLSIALFITESVLHNETPTCYYLNLFAHQSKTTRGSSLLVNPLFAKFLSFLLGSQKCFVVCRLWVISLRTSVSSSSGVL